MERRRLINRLFQSNEYRLYEPGREVNIQDHNISFYMKRHPNREMGTKVTFTREKILMLREAAAQAHLELMDIPGHRFNSAPPETLDTLIPTTSQTSLQNVEQEPSEACVHKNCILFNILPKEIIFRILKELNVVEMTQFVKTCRFGQKHWL